MSYRNDEREEIEYEQGRFANEFQAAYANSQMTTPIRNDKAEIDRLTKAGKFVLVHYHDVYCRYTDAILGVAVELVRSYDAYPTGIAELSGEWDEDSGYYVAAPHQPDPAPQPAPQLDDDEIPF